MTVQSVGPVKFESVSAVTATNSVELGTMVREKNDELIYVYNAGNSQISPGYGAVLSGTTGYSVTVSAVTQVDFAIGVCKHTTLTTGTYGWLVKKGFAPVQMTANESCTTGSILVIGVDGGWGIKSNSTNYQSPAVAKAVSGCASGLSGYAFFSIY